MKRTFIETDFFQKCWKAMGLTNDVLHELQLQLLANPSAGDVMQNTGGARKIRIAFPGQGKSGSARVIYVDFVIKERLYLLMAYPKNKQDNLTDAQKQYVREIINLIRTEGR